MSGKTVWLDVKCAVRLVIDEDYLTRPIIWIDLIDRVEWESKHWLGPNMLTSEITCIKCYASTYRARRLDECRQLATPAAPLRVLSVDLPATVE